jgi:hypothetical protein
VVASACAAALLGVVPACETGGKSEPETVVRTLPAPGYSSVAAKYNERVGRLETLWARAVIRLKYTDEKGKRQEEQGEGLLQVVRPDRLALSIKKAGKMLFWFGGDATRYWLFDVIDEPVARVGRHDLLAARPRDAGFGLDINPKELIRLLGVTPLPIVGAPAAPGDAEKRSARAVAVDPGTTAWSKDGRFIEVRVPIKEGVQVIQLDPETYLPWTITLLDRRGAEVISAVHENFDRVDIANYGGLRPKVAGRITATHRASETEIKLDLAGMKNSGVSPKAFDFDELRRALAVERVIDVDARPPAPRAGSQK